MKKTALLLGLFISLFAFAKEDHGLGRIITADMDLHYIDHVLTGRVGDRVIFAKPEKGAFLNLWHRAEGQDFETILSAKSGSFSGPVQSVDANGKAIDTDFTMTFDTKKGVFVGQVSDRPFEVKVSSKTIVGNHMVSPKFKITFENGDVYEFELKGGEACLGCAARLSYAVIAMLYSAQLL